MQMNPNVAMPMNANMAMPMNANSMPNVIGNDADQDQDDSDDEDFGTSVKMMSQDPNTRPLDPNPFARGSQKTMTPKNNYMLKRARDRHARAKNASLAHGISRLNLAEKENLNDDEDDQMQWH